MLSAPGMSEHGLIQRSKAALGILRRRFAHLASRSGVFRRSRARTGHRHLILTFHRVRPSGQPPDPFDSCPSLPLESFRQILRCVKSRFRVVPLRELAGLGPEAAPAAAITFDDGWRDNYDVAFPILCELKLPATIFVTTGKLGSCRPFWQQALGQLFVRASGDPATERRLREVLRLRPRVALTPQRYLETVRKWKALDTAVLEDRVRVFGWEPNVETNLGRCFLSEDELRTMARAGIEFGSHTVSHAILPLYPREALERELMESRATLECILGSQADMLAYPDGVWDRTVVRLAWKAGYRIGCTTEPRLVSTSDDRLRLPRIEGSEHLAIAASGLDGDSQVLPLGAEHGGRSCREDRTSVRRPRFTVRARFVSRKAGGLDAVHRQSIGTGTTEAQAPTITVLFVIDQLPSWGGGTEQHPSFLLGRGVEGVHPRWTAGGTEQHLSFLLSELPRDEVRLHFALLGAAAHLDAAEFPVSPIFIGNGCRRGWLGAWQRLYRLANLLRSVRPDVIHTFCHTSELTALAAARLAGQGKVLGIRRNCGYWQTPSMLWQTRIAQFLRPQYAANSEAAKSHAVKTEWIPENRITVIRNPVSARRLEEGLRAVPPRASLGIGDDEKVVGIVANLRPIKDHATFLRAGRLVLNRFPQTRFLSVGEPMGETIRGLRALSDSLGMSGRVAWLGAVPNPVSLLPHFHVGVLSSLSESLSNALVEYAAVGLPTVATDVGGTREVVIDGQTGFLVPPRSPEQMAERICQLLANETLTRTLGENARRRVLAHFSERVVLQQYIDLYSRLAGQ